VLQQSHSCLLLLEDAGVEGTGVFIGKLPMELVVDHVHGADDLGAVVRVIK